MKSLALVLAPAAAVLALSGCGASASVSAGKTVDHDKLEAKLGEWAKPRIGDDYKGVTCPSMKAKKGTTVTCTVDEADGESLEMTVTATDDEGNVHFGNDKVGAADAQALQSQIANALAKQNGQTPPDVTCPDEGIIIELHATQRCTMSVDSGTYGVTFTVTKVTAPTQFAYGVKVDSQPTS